MYSTSSSEWNYKDDSLVSLSGWWGKFSTLSNLYDSARISKRSHRTAKISKSSESEKSKVSITFKKRDIDIYISLSSAFFSLPKILSFDMLSSFPYLQRRKKSRVTIATIFSRKMIRGSFTSLFWMEEKMPTLVLRNVWIRFFLLFFLFLKTFSPFYYYTNTEYIFLIKCMVNFKRLSWFTTQLVERLNFFKPRSRHIVLVIWKIYN